MTVGPAKAVPGPMDDWSGGVASDLSPADALGVSVLAEAESATGLLLCWYQAVGAAENRTAAQRARTTDHRAAKRMMTMLQPSSR